MGTAAPFLAVRPPAAAPLRRIGHLRHCSKCPPPRQTSSAGGFDSKTPCFGVLQNPSMSCSLSRRDTLICSCLLRFLPQFLPFCHFLTPFSLVLFVQIGAFSYVQIAYSPADSTQKRDRRMLGGHKTVICEFLGTGMISVMPVPLLSVHPREYSQQGHIRYVPSVCVYRWTCPVPPHKPPLQAL